MPTTSLAHKEVAYRNLFSKLSPQTPEMVFDGKQVPPSVLPGFAKFQGMEKLSLIDCNLWSLEGMPRLPNLRVLMLGDNHLEDLSVIPACFPNLEKLSIVGNKFGHRDELEPLTRLPKLRALDVEGNDLCEIRGHDRWMVDTFPRVKQFIITAYDVDSDEDDNDDISWFLSDEAMDADNEEEDEGDAFEGPGESVPEVITID
ncbi:acidic leucine-rich nuclear phosphoprotein 32 family member A-like [Paramacrobiotus metropolitanus]|uniref:acidic leucine-rich nuclear phosphoprotein 32 family member A-like n=1 Tax=Paramacrobiotus metropolitanus TaxID=2943436 RepID=UPI00244582FF|nr:acidic leucine-rich nuclear phosphoprotein 32 family member A-like [Paramacrobiotus metropolitanus]